MVAPLTFATKIKTTHVNNRDAIILTSTIEDSSISTSISSINNEEQTPFAMLSNANKCLISESTEIQIQNSIFDNHHPSSSSKSTLTAVNPNDHVYLPPSSIFEEMLPSEEEKVTTYGDSHALYGSLMGNRRIEHFKVYRRVNLNEVINDDDDDDNSHRNIALNDGDETIGNELALLSIRVGDKLCSQPGIVHGGITSFLLDDCLGWGYDSMQIIK